MQLPPEATLSPFPMHPLSRTAFCPSQMYTTVSWEPVDTHKGKTTVVEGAEASA